jgi:NitT/TauT family transport system ATP-binding protein
MSMLEFDRVSFSYARGCDTLARVSVMIEPGQFVSVMGPNGCGKSTFLRLAAGLLRPAEGCVLWDGREIAGPSVDRGFLPQRPTLFDWLPIWENVAFGLRMRGVARAARRRAALDLLESLGLGPWQDRYPLELSGGMRARVALAMTLANEPSLICLDESFGALDYQTRLVSLQVLLHIWRRKRQSIIAVTHHISEAMLADRVLVFSGRPGRIELDRCVEHACSERREVGVAEDSESQTIVEKTLREAALAAYEHERMGLSSVGIASDPPEAVLLLEAGSRSE